MTGINGSGLVTYSPFFLMIFHQTGMAGTMDCLVIYSNALMVLPMNKVDGYTWKLLQESRATGNITAQARTTCGVTIIQSDQLIAT